MRNFILRRLIQIPGVLLLITVLVFGLMHVSPGDPVQIALGVYTSPESIAAMKKEFNLDEPLYKQYMYWLGDAVRGDLGRSIRTSEEVTEIISSRFPISLTLASVAMLFALLVAIPVGVLAAYKHNSKFDFASMFMAMAGMSIPNFALALLLIFGLSVRLGWFPITGLGRTEFVEDPIGFIKPYVLPALSLSAVQIAILSRFLRSSMLEILGQDYIRTAYAKGLTSRMVLTRHALKSSLIPLITVAGVNFAHLVGSTITIEFIFAIPGLGTALIEAVKNRDFPVIQGMTLFIAIFFILTNLLADVLYGVVDPRIRY